MVWNHKPKIDENYRFFENVKRSVHTYPMKAAAIWRSMLSEIPWHLHRRFLRHFNYIDQFNSFLMVLFCSLQLLLIWKKPGLVFTGYGGGLDQWGSMSRKDNGHEHPEHSQVKYFLLELPYFVCRVHCVNHNNRYLWNWNELLNGIPGGSPTGSLRCRDF